MEWLDAEIQLYINNKGPFNLYVINHRLKSRSLTPSTSPTPTPAVSNDLPTAELPSPTDVTAPSTDVTAPSTDVTAPSPTNVTAPSTNVTAPPTNATAPSTKATAAVNYGRDLATLAKMYTEESKYSGEDDNFDRKLMIFNDLCDRVDIPQEAKIKGFPTMLRSIALDFYYENKATYTTFDDICNAVRNHFEGPEYKRGVLTKWNAITLKTVIIKNEGKSTGDCLQLLLNDLRHLQHGLDANLYNDDFLYNKLIVAC
jgi:hypothetical protein